MKSFKNILSEDEMSDVATFVRSEFMGTSRSTAAYHTTENGWPDHQAKYGLAYPFVTGEIPMDRPIEELEPGQIAGRHLFQRTCVTCHDTGIYADPGEPWDTYPLSHQGCGVVCHKDGTVDFPWKKGHRPGDGSSIPSPSAQGAKRPDVATSKRTPFDAHSVPPTIADLTAQQKRGAVLFGNNCAFCHAQDGTGKNWIGAFLEPHARNLTDEEATAHLRSSNALVAVIRNGIENTSMPAWKTVLKETEIEDIAAYVRRAFFFPTKSSQSNVEK